MTTPAQPRQLVVLSGPSGVGKSTIIQGLLEDPLFALSISATTRSPRPGETHGVEYFFLTQPEFERRIADHEFVEWALVHGRNYYGTLKSEIERILGTNRVPLLDIDVQGAAKIRGRVPARFLFIAPPSLDELIRRIDGRSTETPETRAARIESAKREMEESHLYDHIVVNDKLADTIAQIRTLLDANKAWPASS